MLSDARNTTRRGRLGLIVGPAFRGVIAVLGAVAVAKVLIKSKAGRSSDEIDVVSILADKELVLPAGEFGGGKVLAVLGGAAIDLRRATPTANAINLNVAICCGGLGLLVPEGWRVHSDLKLTAGRVGDTTRSNDDSDAVTVYLTGFVVLGGVGVVSGSVARQPI